MRSRSLSLVLLLITLGLANTLAFQKATASTNVTGVILSDTTWTKVGSPYFLIGPIRVNSGVTLIVESGATVNLGSYYIQVEGSLQAVGIEAEQVRFNGGQIRFMQSSVNWSEQSRTGCVIENSVLDSTSITIDTAYPRIYGNSIFASISVFGSSTISNNTIVGLLTITGGSPIVTNNTLSGGVTMSTSDTPTITGNIITAKGGKGIEVNGGNGSIVGNVIYECTYGVLLSPVQVFGGTWAPYATVERNLIVNNTYGIGIGLGSRFEPGSLCPTILNNTISGNSFGIYLSVSNYLTTPLIAYNNIQDNFDYNFYLGAYTSGNVNASLNWWGTTNTSAIEQKIFDFDRDFTLGNVTFTPLLSQSNLQAAPPWVPESFPSWIILSALLISTTAGTFIHRKKKP